MEKRLMKRGFSRWKSMPVSTPFFQAFGPLLFGRRRRLEIQKIKETGSLGELYELFGELLPDRHAARTRERAVPLALGSARQSRRGAGRSRLLFLCGAWGARAARHRPGDAAAPGTQG